MEVVTWRRSAGRLRSVDHHWVLRGLCLTSRPRSGSVLRKQGRHQRRPGGRDARHPRHVTGGEVVPDEQRHGGVALPGQVHGRCLVPGQCPGRVHGQDRGLRLLRGLRQHCHRPPRLRGRHPSPPGVVSARPGRHLQTVWCPLHHHGHDGQVEEGCHGQDQDRGGGGGQRGPSGPGQLTASTGCQHQLGDIFFSWVV